MTKLFGWPIEHATMDQALADPRLAHVFGSPVPPVVVFPVSHPVGLSVIRTLTGQGIPVLGLDFKPRAAGLFSRHATGLCVHSLNPDAASFEDQMMALGAAFRCKPVVFLVDDEDLFLSLKHQERWEQAYRLPLSPWPVVHDIVDKGRFYRKLQAAGFPLPHTWFMDSLADLDRQRDDIRYPCILKPTYSTRFRQVFGVKAKRFDDFDTLRAYAETVFAEGIEFIVQEFIEGPAQELYTYAAYSDKNGDTLAGFMGRKLHQYPPDFGTCRLGESVNEPKLEETGQWLLRLIGYKGISLTEYKRDAATGAFKLIELNPRPGDWPERLAQICGSNLVLAAYRDACGLPVEKTRITRFGAKWCNMAEDLYYCVRGYRLYGYPEEHRGLGGWLRDLRGLASAAFATWDDPLPALVRFAGMVPDFRERERAWSRGER